MARKTSVASATDAADEASETSQDVERSQGAEGQEGEQHAPDDHQAPEHPEDGSGDQAGSATGEKTEHGAEAGESDVGAKSAEGEGATTSHMEAVQRSGDLSGATGDIPPGSTGTRAPSPELSGLLGGAEKTAMRTEQQVEDRAAGPSRRTERKMANDQEELEELNAELAEVQGDLDRLLKRRDDILTRHDRLSERVASANSVPFGEVTADYFKASDAALAEEAAIRKTLRQSGLGSLLKV